MLGILECPRKLASSVPPVRGRGSCFLLLWPNEILTEVDSLLKHVKAGKCHAFGSVSVAILPLSLFFVLFFLFSLGEREDVTTGLSLVGVLEQTEHLAVIESHLRKEIHLWPEVPWAEGMSANTLLRFKSPTWSNMVNMVKSPTWSVCFSGLFSLPQAFPWLQSERKGKSENGDANEVQYWESTRSPREGTAVSVPLGHCHSPMRFCG